MALKHSEQQCVRNGPHGPETQRNDNVLEMGQGQNILEQKFSLSV
jgi:hypothetical protein